MTSIVTILNKLHHTTVKVTLNSTADIMLYVAPAVNRQSQLLVYMKKDLNFIDGLIQSTFMNTDTPPPRYILDKLLVLRLFVYYLSSG